MGEYFNEGAGMAMGVLGFFAIIVLGLMILGAFLTILAGIVVGVDTVIKQRRARRGLYEE